MSDMREAFDRIDRLFISGNSIPVERAVITREMWGGVKAWQAALSSSPEIPDNSGSDSEKPNSSEAVAWSWENHGRQVTVDKAFADELISDGEIVRPLIFGDTRPASADVPKGWKLVPVEPTTGMIEAAFDAFEVVKPMQYRDGNEARKAVYTAMISASPCGSQPTHARVYEYDGSFECIDCGAQWGALHGNPKEPEHCTTTKTDEHITVHEYTARSSLDALKFYTEWMQRRACGDPEPIEHHYAMQAIDELEALLSKQEGK